MKTDTTNQQNEINDLNEPMSEISSGKCLQDHLERFWLAIERAGEYAELQGNPLAPALGRNMIPSNNEFTERQFGAAYCLILLWPKRDAQCQDSRSSKLITENTGHVTNSWAMQDSDTTGTSENG
jgi:hypothetical protein